MIEFIQTEEGLARRNGTDYSYEYNLTDHLGNVRATFYKNPNGQLAEVIQRDDYFAFGLRKMGIPNSNLNKYLYNGKELQEELGQYDYGARFYDPVIGRWNVVDPLVELYQESTSPYIYVQNNPILLTDPDGRYPDGPGDDLWDFIKGAGRGIATGAKGTVNFVTDGAWKAETWKATGNLALGLVASNATGPGGIANTYSLDAALGTNTSGAVNGFNGAIASGLNKLENGNARQKGEVVG